MTDPRKSEPDEVEDLLLSALYRRGADERPPPEVDSAIREQARRVARRRRWFALPRLAVALSLLLGVGVALRVFEIAPPEQTVVELKVPEEQEEALSTASVPGSSGAEPDERVFDRRPVQPALQDAAPQATTKSVRESMEQRMFERAKRQPAGSPARVCAGDIPPSDAGPLEWLRRIRDLRQAGEQARASCLQDLYRERFSEPDQLEPQSMQE